MILDKPDAELPYSFPPWTDFRHPRIGSGRLCRPIGAVMFWRWSEIILFDLVQKRLITDLQIVCRRLAVPARELQRLCDRGSFRTSLQVSHHMLQALLVAGVFRGRG